VAVEEGAVDLRPAGAVRDRKPERRKDERGADERDRDGAAAVARLQQAAEDLGAPVVVQSAT
jgi:hypothetical protein